MSHGGKRPGAGRKPSKPRDFTPAFAVIEGGSGAVPEPDWSLIYSDELEIARARDYWRQIITELRDTEKLATANLHQVKRLVTAYLLVDGALEKVAEEGPIIVGKRGGMIRNPWLDVLKDGNAMAAAAESELTITPRRRNNGGKVTKKPKAAGGAATYLQPVAGRPGHALGPGR